jgi:hypothetical protein
VYNNRIQQRSSVGYAPDRLDEARHIPDAIRQQVADAIGTLVGT